MHCVLILLCKELIYDLTKFQYIITGFQFGMETPLAEAPPAMLIYQLTRRVAIMRRIDLAVPVLYCSSIT